MIMQYAELCGPTCRARTHTCMQRLGTVLLSYGTPVAAVGQRTTATPVWRLGSYRPARLQSFHVCRIAYSMLLNLCYFCAKGLLLCRRQTQLMPCHCVASGIEQHRQSRYASGTAVHLHITNPYCYPMASTHRRPLHKDVLLSCYYALLPRAWCQRR